MRLGGRRAIVTGGTGALGSAIASALAADGSDVAVIGRDTGRAEQVAASVAALGVRALGLTADLTDFDDASRAVDTVVDAWGGVDILVNAAGGGAVAPFHELTETMWREQIDGNLTQVFNVTRCVVPSMRAQRDGRIINISSIAAVSGGRLVQGAVAYAAAKAGVIGLTKALAIELADTGITVNALAPGAQATPGRESDTPERREALLSQIPTRRLGDPEHLAQTVVWLSAPESVNVTGIVLPLDGGHSI